MVTQAWSRLVAGCVRDGHRYFVPIGLQREMQYYANAVLSSRVLAFEGLPAFDLGSDLCKDLNFGRTQAEERR
jgi:hypothetical protein